MMIVFETTFRRGGAPDPARLDKGREGCARALDVADRALMTQGYLAGDLFSLADICWLPYLQYLSATPYGGLITERPHVASWWKRIGGRPTWRKVTG